MTLLGLALALLVGLTLGLLGGGGAILTVPIFVYVLGLEPKTAIATSLAAVGGTTLVGVLSHWRQGNVAVRVALFFGGFAMLGAFAGARGAHRLPAAVQLTLFGVVTILAALAMLRSARRDGAVPAAPYTGGDAGAVWERLRRPRAAALLALQGMAVGALSAVVGVGGGFLIVPALVLLGGLSMRLAVGTSLLVIFLNAASGVAGYAGRVAIDWAVAASFAAAAMGGIAVGSRLVPHVPQGRLKQAFAVLLLAVGAFVLSRR